MTAVIQVKRGTAAGWTSANTVLAAGEIGFETDTKKMKVGDGSTAWTSLGYTVTDGDISGVTAGTGLSGGGNSGAVTITNSMATEITAKADLIVGTGNATFDNLAVGANNTVLTADSSTATGLKWGPGNAGGMTLLASGSMAGLGTISITNINQTHKNLILWVYNYYENGSAASPSPGMRFNGSSTSQTYYTYANTINGANYNRDSIDFLVGADGNQGYGFTYIEIYNYTGPHYKLMTMKSHNSTHISGAQINGARQEGIWKDTSAINQITFFRPVTAFTAGNYELYGVR